MLDAITNVKTMMLKTLTSINQSQIIFQVGLEAVRQIHYIVERIINYYLQKKFCFPYFPVFLFSNNSITNINTASLVIPLKNRNDCCLCCCSRKANIFTSRVNWFGALTSVIFT